jgi:hypothetical protein
MNASKATKSKFLVLIEEKSDDISAKLEHSLKIPQLPCTGDRISDSRSGHRAPEIETV